MTDFRVTLKSNILSIENKNKKKVQIRCANNKSGNLVSTTISRNSNMLYPGHKVKNIAYGISAKDFTIKFKNEAGAAALYENLQNILNDPTIPVEAPVESGLNNVKDGLLELGDRLLDTYFPETSAPASAPPKNDNTTVIVVGAAFVMLIVIILVVWKMQK